LKHHDWRAFPAIIAGKAATSMVFGLFIRIKDQAGTLSFFQDISNRNFMDIVIIVSGPAYKLVGPIKPNNRYFGIKK
jgi:hypothetical protein